LKSYGLAFLEKDFDALKGKEPSGNRMVSKGTDQETICWEVTKLSEEHGWLQQIEGIPFPSIGTRMVIVPNHSCPVVNLTDTLHVQGPHTKHWKVLSRGCTQ
jgi:D-serine deaminase-like pyridoxal phosphate-dependent protein